jgi:hypothetical protein
LAAFQPIIFGRFWVIPEEHSPQEALELRSAFVATNEGEIVGFVAGAERAASIAMVKCSGLTLISNSAAVVLDTNSWLRLAHGLLPRTPSAFA